MTDLEGKVGEITVALNEIGIKANVLVDTMGKRKKRQTLRIKVSNLTEQESKEQCNVIGEIILDKLGYGTTDTSYQGATLTYVYTPLRQENPKSEKTSRYKVPGCS